MKLELNSSRPLRDGGEADAPCLMLISDGCCEQTLHLIAESLLGQSDPVWLWLIVSEQLPLWFQQHNRIKRLDELADAALWLQSDRCAAWIHLNSPGALRDPCSLEKVRWCLHGSLRTRYVAYSDDLPSSSLVKLSRRPSTGIFWTRGRGVSALPFPVMQLRAARSVLMLLPWLEPGGADRCNLDMICYLAAQGWQVCVVASLAARHAWQGRFRELTSDVLILPHFLRAESALEFLFACLDSRRPDLLLSSNCRLAYDVLPVIRASYPQLPVLMLNHMEEAWGDGGYPGLAVRAGNAIDRHWVVSDHLCDWLVSRGVEATRVRTLHWYADASRWAPCPGSRRRFRKRLGIPEAMPVIVYAGRICRQKRPDILVRSLSSLAASGRDFVALVIGDGELAPELHRGLQQTGLKSRVHCLGWQGEEGLRAAFQGSDLLFLPSEAEGVALVLYEAMACGLAVLAANVGGQAELVNDDCGRLIAPGREQEYPQALQELLANPEKLRRMGEAARRRILHQFDAKGFSHRLEQLIKEVEFKPWSRSIAPSLGYRRALVRLQWQWSFYRLSVKFNQERLASVPLVGRPLSLVLKAMLYACVWGIGMCR